MAWIINNQIQLKYDKWPILEVDCFTKPHALIVDSLVPGLYDTYLFYAALFKSYGFSHHLHEGEEWSFGLHPYIVEKLGFKYNFHQCTTINEFRQLIISKLNKGVPLLIPGNLISLYYSWAYKKENALHLFIVKGYEKELKLYSIQDNMHIMTQAIPDISDESGFFNNFLIPQKIMEEMWETLNAFPLPYYVGKVMTIEKTKAIIETPTSVQKLRSFTDYLNIERNLLRYRELSVLQYMIQFFCETGQPVDGRERNFRLDIIFSNKKALLSMIFKLLKDVAKDDSITEASKQMEDIINGWEKLKRIFYLNLMRGSLNDINDLKYSYIPIINSEEKFLNIAYKISVDNKWIL